MKKIRDDLAKMSEYERYKVALDFARLLATLAVPFVMIAAGYLAKHYLGW